MCGIAGIIGKPDNEIVEKMLAATRHRGPDDNGIYNDEVCSIGMNRLSIIDLSHAGHQPMSSADERYWIVYNGEIYNFAEQRKKLIEKGYIFKSHTDTEVLLNLYIEYGADCLKYIRGMFAFVIWDKLEKKAFGARDHMGIKPFLYHNKNNNLTFCSEMKGLLQVPYIKKKLDINGLQLYLSFGYVSPPYTIINEVKALMPGNSFIFQNGEMIITKYWDFDKIELSDISYNEAKEKVRNLVISSVKEELVSDVPLGLFLSGGLDSTVVLAAMRLAGNKNISSFSLGFKNFDRSEEGEAEVAAKHFSTNHHSIMIDGEIVRNEFDNFIISIDQPNIDGLNTYLVSKYTKNNVTVALSGLGPDELFLGYKWQRSAAKPEWLNSMLQYLVQNQFNNLKKIWPKRYIGVLKYLKAVSQPKIFYSQNNRVMDDEAVSDILSMPNFSGKLINDLLDLYDNPAETDIYRRISRLDMKLFMGARVLGVNDTTSMIHSLEVRFPLIDKRLVEFAYSLPAHYKMDLKKSKNIKPWSNYENEASYEESGVKKILYEAFKDDLPEGFGLRAKKGFKFPYGYWLKNELKEICEESLRFSNPVIDKTFSDNLLLQFQSGNYNFNKVWTMLILNKWMEANKIEV